LPEHTLLAHVDPVLGEESVGHTWPHPPQLLLSFWTLTQVVPHAVNAAWQMHAPAWHVLFVPQAAELAV
jgi:hypothetical protein